MDEVSVILPDGSRRGVPRGSTVADVAASIGARLAKAAVAGTVNGIEVDLVAPVADGDEVAVLTADSPAGRHVLRHSTAHVLAQAVLQLFPGAKFTIGPAIEDGFYYDFDLPDGRTFTEEDLVAIEERMRAIVAADQPFRRSEVPVDEALRLFEDQPYKCEIIRRVTSGSADGHDSGEVAAGDTMSLYRNTDEFVDLCKGPHVPSTGRLGHFALMKVAGAYWRGNEKGPMLQRVYGTAWESEAALREHLHRLEEAAKRDHRRLAAEMDLLSFPAKRAPGIPRTKSGASPRSGPTRARNRLRRPGSIRDWAIAPGRGCRRRSSRSPCWPPARGRSPSSCGGSGISSPVRCAPKE